jgi:hypothetical protein
MADELKYLMTFKEEMIKFIDELIDLFNTEPSFILIRIFVSDKIPTKDVLGRFMKECLPYYQYVKDRNSDFFVYSDFIYEQYVEDVGDDNLKNFRTLWESSVMTDEIKDIVWQWLDFFIELSLKYYNKFNCVEGWEFDLNSSTHTMNGIIHTFYKDKRPETNKSKTI